jgi:hypothetical protein
MAVPVIDLGLDRVEPDLSVRSPRRLSVLVVLTLAFVLAGPGAASPAPPRFVELFVSASADSFWLAPQALHVVSRDGTELSTYRLDGTLQWTVPLRRPRQGYSELQVDLAEGLILVTVRGGVRPLVSEVWAYDAATGELRWRADGGVAFAAPGASQVVLHRADEFAVVDSRTGTVAWTFHLPPGEQLDVRLDHLLLLDAAGVLTVRDLGTGTVLATRQLPGPVAPRYAQSVGSLVLVSEPRPDGIALGAYRRATLDPQWTVVGLPLETSVISCPPVLCVTVADGLLVLDLQTGIQLWTGGWIQAFGLGTPWPDGYLLGERFVAVGSTEMMGFVVTARTGEVVVDMRGWLPATGALGAPQPVVRRRISGGRVWFGVVRPDLERVEPLGTLDDAWGPCATVGDLLACRTIDHRVRVWRVRG